MFVLVSSMPHRAIREPHAANRHRAVDRQPDFKRRILLGILPACGNDTSQPAGHRFLSIDPAIAVHARHLRNEAKRRLGGVIPASWKYAEENASLENWLTIH